jgi:protein phosphatase
MGLLAGHASHRGRVREKNEDNYCILLPPAVAEGLDALLAVADGMGGHQAGEVASGFVVQRLTELFSTPEHRQWVDYSPTHEDYYVAVLKEVLEQLNEQLHGAATSQHQLQGMGTTATVALLSQKRLFIGHVGDSRAYLVRNGEIQQLTKDHSWVAEEVEHGRLTLQAAATHAKKNILTRCLGNGLLVRVDRFSQPIAAGDRLVLCTDGLSNMVSDEEIWQSVQSQADPQQACDRLLDLANQRGGPDNITVLVAHVVGHSVESTPSGGRVMGQSPSPDQAAITQKIMRRALDSQPRARVSIALLGVIALLGLLAGGSTVAVVLTLFPALSAWVQFSLLPSALPVAVAMAVVCTVALIVIGARALRR